MGRVQMIDGYQLLKGPLVASYTRQHTHTNAHIDIHTQAQTHTQPHTTQTHTHMHIHTQTQTHMQGRLFTDFLSGIVYQLSSLSTPK